MTWCGVRADGHLANVHTLIFEAFCSFSSSCLALQVAAGISESWEAGYQQAFYLTMAFLQQQVFSDKTCFLHTKILPVDNVASITKPVTKL